MTESIRDAYIATADPKWQPLLAALDRAIMAARPDLSRRVAYGLLMYTLGGDHRHWVVSIGAKGKAATLRFLWGALLSDPHKVLRAGTSHLESIDYPSLESVDAALIAEYLGEAVAKMDYFREHERDMEGPKGKRSK